MYSLGHHNQMSSEVTSLTFAGSVDNVVIIQPYILIVSLGVHLDRHGLF